MTLPKNDVLHVKGILNYSCCWHSDSEDVLEVWQVGRLGNPIQVGEIAEIIYSNDIMSGRVKKNQSRVFKSQKPKQGTDTKQA